MDDLISRQAAIDAVETIGFDFSDSGLSAAEIEEVCEAIGDVRQAWSQRIKRLPSAQPEGIYYVKFSEEDYEKMAEQMRKSSPILISAQPEVIRCKDCKWHEGRYHCLNFDVFGFDYNDYCSLAARKEQDDG